MRCACFRLEAVMVTDRFHQRCGFFFKRIVLAVSRRKKRRLNFALVTHAVKAAVR
jgi:hypothetical protein